MIKNFPSDLPATVLKGGVIVMLLGRAWQFLFWEVPIRTFFWDETLLRPILARFNISWEAYVSDLSLNFTLDFFTQVIGLFFLLSAVVLVGIPRFKSILTLLHLNALCLFLLALLYWKEHFLYLGEFLEYSLQWSSPLFLAYILHQPKKISRRFILSVQLAIAATFIGHGLYAVGYYPTPGNFAQMISTVFHFSDKSSYQFLKMMGVLDFIAAGCIFFPKVQKASLWYCTIWGFLTAFARLVAHFDASIPLESLHQWLPAVFYRLVHGGVPFFLILLLELRNRSLES